MTRKNRPQYLLVDFEERTNDFIGYFKSLASSRDLKMIRDRNSFEFVLQKAFSKDSSLRPWVNNIGSGVVDTFFESHYVQDIIERNKRGRSVVTPTTEERRVVRTRLNKFRDTSFVPVKPTQRKFFKGYIKEKPVRVVKVTIKSKGKDVTRYRDIKTGRWASINKQR